MRLPIMLTLVVAGSPFLYAADFKGASEVLLEAAQAGPKAKEKAPDPFEAFREKLKTYQAQSASLSPAEAARQWLTLVDEFEKESERPRGPGPGAMRMLRPLEFDEVMNSLPAPAAWAELQKAVESRTAGPTRAGEKRELGLRLIAHTLNGNTTRRAEDLKTLDALVKKSSGAEAEYNFSYILEMLNQAIFAQMDDPEAILRMLTTQLSEAGDSPMPLNVPNLVALVGPEKAEAFFRKALMTSRQLQLEPGTPTHKLGTKVALEMVDQMPHAQWSLVNSLDSVELYEAMDKKFNQSKKEPSEPTPDTGLFNVRRQRGFREEDTQAKTYYFLGLIAHDRINDAIKVAKDFDRNSGGYFPPEVITQMERVGLTLQLNNFFATLLKDNPESPFWDEYIRVAAHAGKADEALNLIRTTAARSDLSKSRRAELRSLLPTALLANDEVEAAISELRHNMTNQEPANPGESYYSIQSAATTPALQIAKIGQLLDRKEWIEEGIAAVRKELDQANSPTQEYWRAPAAELAYLLSDLKRGPEAEEILLKSLRKAISNEKGSRREFQSFNQGQEKAASVLAQLLKVYYSADRYNDVLQLLDAAQDWGAGDLAGLENAGLEGSAYYFGAHHAVETPLAFYAASALGKAGRTEDANLILNHLFDEYAGLDRLYELLLELSPTNAAAKLDELYARDQFEERPLIWKAHWLRTHGRLEEAEATARKAISIDPSDGEEGPGDRLRAYAELADIRAARGDAKEAEFLRGAVAAIRESETADRYHEVGLLKRAVKMYQDSLTHFADAYCIQSRLAIQLADLGLHAEAEEHYRRAYELMPESFGRVESHCFGCERAFEGERAQGIAEKVFTEIAQKTPNKPQVHYLLGYLREEQDRPKEALEHYRKAVQLDPDYLNAWHKIGETGRKTFIPAAERDLVAFNLIRLDPRARHGGCDFSAVTDLAGLWKQVAQIQPPSRGAVTNLYPLTASAKKLQEEAAVAGSTDETDMRETITRYRQDQVPSTPAAAVSQNSFVRAGSALVSRSVGVFE